MKGLIFEPEAHAFFWKGEPVSSVTTALKGQGIIDGRFYNEAGRLRGANVHRATELYDNQILDWETVGRVEEPYLAAYINWKQETKPGRFYGVEEPVLDKLLWVAGIVDRRYKVGGSWALLDIKTGAQEWWHPLQLTAYGLAVGGGPLLFSLYLKRNGRYKYAPVSYEIPAWEHIIKAHNMVLQGRVIA